MPSTANSETKLTAKMVTVPYPEMDTIYYVTDDQYEYHYASRLHVPQHDPKSFVGSLEVQSSVIVKKESLTVNNLWPTRTANELMGVIGAATLPDGDIDIDYKKVVYKGSVYFFHSKTWATKMVPLLEKCGKGFPTIKAAQLACFVYFKGSVIKCNFSTTLGTWADILDQLERVSYEIFVDGEPPACVIKPNKDQYSVADVQAILDENEALKKELERLESNQVWYVNAVEALSPFRYAAHQLLESPDRPSLRDALKMVSDKAEAFFTKQEK